MPDIIQDGSNELMLWLDELCSTCDVRDGCPLLSAIKELGLITYGGCHVAYCIRYEGDPVMTLDTDAESAKPINLQTALQQLKKQLLEMERTVKSAQEVPGA